MKARWWILAAASIGSLWYRERLTTSRLEIEIEARRNGARSADAVLRERDRLRALQPSAAELRSLRRAGTERAALQLSAATQDVRRLPVVKLDLGEWRPASSWKNCGQATPNAAIESMLWAAAGGDVTIVKSLLSISDETRQQAEALLARLPTAARGRYVTVEDLIAELTVKNIPLGSAQLVWFNQPNDDTASACLFLQSAPNEPQTAPVPVTTHDQMPTQTETKGTATRASSGQLAVAEALPLPSERPAQSQPPGPQLLEDPKTSATYLSLRREGDVWRLVVPPSAIATFAKQLTSATP